jgi:4-hydroxybenzoate polyprenyltransferase
MSLHGTKMETSRRSPPLTAARAARGLGLAAVVESLRLGQWVKNGFVFAPLIFSHGLTNWSRDAQVLAAALIFCLVSSAVYLINDILDADEDRRHPLKCLRPIASGRLAVRGATVIAALLTLTGMVGAWVLDRWFFGVVAVFLAVNLLYSTLLKHVMLVDVFMIAAGFVLRVLGGAVVIHVEVSAWLIACTTLLALFLALAKRRHELVLLKEDAAGHRAILAHYTPYFLDQLIGVVTASTVMSYTLYTLSEDVKTKFPGKRLELTIPFVLFGIFRYLYLIHRNEGGGNPTRLLFTDGVLLTVVVMWAAAVILIIYIP